MNHLHYSYGHLHEGLLYDTAKQLGVKLTGELQPCAGCSLGKSLRKAIPSTTTSRATSKLERVYVDLTGKKHVATLGGNHYALIIRDCFTRFTWLFFLKHKSEAAESFERFLGLVREHGSVMKVRSDEGGEFTGKAFRSVCTRHQIKQELTTADSPRYNGVAERALGIIEATSRAARIQAPLIFRGANVPTDENLWGEAALWACNSLNESATTANPDRVSPFQMWYGQAPPVTIRPFLKPCYYRSARRRRKSEPRGELGYYLGKDYWHQWDCMRVLSSSGKLITTRNVTWWSPAKEMTGREDYSDEAGTTSGDGTGDPPAGESTDGSGDGDEDSEPSTASSNRHSDISSSSSEGHDELSEPSSSGDHTGVEVHTSPPSEPPALTETGEFV